MSFTPQISITSKTLTESAVFKNGKWYVPLGSKVRMAITWQGGQSPYYVNWTSTLPGTSRVTHNNIVDPPEDVSPEYIPTNTGLYAIVGVVVGSGLSQQIRFNATASLGFNVLNPSDPIFGGGAGGGLPLGSILLQASPTSVTDQTTAIQFSGVTKATDGTFLPQIPLGLVIDGVIIPNTVIATSDANGVFSFQLTEEQTRTYQVFDGSVFSNAVSILFNGAGGGGGGGSGGGGGGGGSGGGGGPPGIAAAVITLPFFMGFITIFYRERKKAMQRFYAIRKAITRTVSVKERQFERALALLRGRR